MTNHEEIIEKLGKAITQLDTICYANQYGNSFDDCDKCPLALKDKGKVNGCVILTVSKARTILMADEGKLRQIESLIQNI